VDRYYLGDLLKLSEEKNYNSQYGINSVKGVSIQKSFIETKADMTGVSLLPYLVVRPDYFSYVSVTSRNGGKISIAYNNSDETFVVSSSYIVFFVDRTDILLPEYIFLYFNRPEFDRYARFHSWGSAREVFSWDDMCDIEIDLPSVPIQQKYVDVYNALSQNQKVYEKGLDDLKLACDAYIENVRHKIPLVEIGGYIEQTEEYNSKLKYGKDDVMGMTITKEIIPTKAYLDETSFEKYIIIKPQYFIYNPRTHGKKIGLGFNNIGKTFIITWNNIAFKIKEQTENTLLPGYLYLFFKRAEWDRWACFNSWGSSTEVFAWEDLCETKIPIPDIEIQQAIVNIFNAYHERKMMAEKLKKQMKNICSILVKGAMGELQ
jgi:type I restriction enzyme, S subunit